MPAPDRFWHALSGHPPADTALVDDHGELSFAGLLEQVARRAAALEAYGSRVLALALENSREWLLWDLAALRAGVVCVPIPGFLSDTQWRHLLLSTGADTLIGSFPDGISPEEFGFSARPPGWRRRRAAVELPAGTAKITFTSGSTGQPRGVCLSARSVFQVAESLHEACNEVAPGRHLSLLPLGVLLENVGVYAALLAGAPVHLPADSGVGASSVDVSRLLGLLERRRPESLILVPQLLQGLLHAARMGWSLPDSLRFIAVGGARVAPALLHQAAELGWPVFEGYGLSECASVVCLNRPGHNRMGTVGTPLPHARISIAPDGEILVHGARPLGYLGDRGPVPDPWPTGDIGSIEDGYLVIRGRRKNQFITAYGRNVNPEWIEAELTHHPAIAQAVVHGEALPLNLALIVPRGPAVTRGDIEQAIAQVNHRLPDYARIGAWLPAGEPFTPENGLLTANGRLRRDAVLELHRPALIGLIHEDLTP
jgi:long-chain acyl-CoA synthetase